MDEKREGARPFFKRTRDSDALFNGSERAEEILKMFWGYPVGIVRKQCLQALNRQPVDEQSACWLEERIAAITSDNYIYDGHPFWENLLSWYLFNTYSVSNSLRTRALEFTVSLLFGGIRIENGATALPVGCELWGRIAKMIAGAIRKYPELYWAPSVPEFLEASLAHENWTIRERAIELICIAEDSSFFERIVELSRKAKDTHEKTKDYRKKENVREQLAAGKLRGFLGKAAYLLLLCKTEEAESDTKVFKAALTKAIGERASQNPPEMRISLYYAKDGKLGSIEMHVSPVMAQARDLLEKCEVSISALGIEITNAERETSHPEGYGLYRYPQYCARFSFSRDLSSANCNLSVKQVRKTARLVVSVNLLDQGTHQLGRWIDYLHRGGE